jgi:hypothetical protein
MSISACRAGLSRAKPRGALRGGWSAWACRAIASATAGLWLIIRFLFSCLLEWKCRGSLSLGGKMRAFHSVGRVCLVHQKESIGLCAYKDIAGFWAAIEQKIKAREIGYETPPELRVDGRRRSEIG